MNKKIAHINIFPKYIPGIHKKLKGQAVAAVKEDLAIDFHLLSLEPYKSEEKFFPIQHKSTNLNLPFVNKCTYKLFRFSNIEKHINLESYDHIILRYPFVNSLQHNWFAEKYGKIVTTEHHTDEVRELLTGSIRDKILSHIEKKYSPKFLENMSSIIGVTDEICKVELEKSGPKPHATISNGIDLDNVKQTGFKKYNGKELNLLFMASNFAPWHGLDRFLESLLSYRGNTNVHLNILGGLPPHYKKLIWQVQAKPNVEVIVHGFLYNEKLDQIFRESTIAIGSLAMHRNFLKEGCILKLREYTARGIPFIYAYKDVDFDNEKLGFLRKFPNNDSTIEIEQIFEFAEQLKDQQSISEQMREFAMNKLDWRIKVRQMYDFANSLE